MFDDGSVKNVSGARGCKVLVKFQLGYFSIVIY